MTLIYYSLLQGWLGVIAKEWSSAPPDVKTKFESESAKLMEQYKAETVEWETKMIHDGKISYVRKQSLINIRDKKKRSKNETPKNETPEKETPKTITPTN